MAEKEHSLSERRVNRIGREVHAVCPEFDAEAFARDVVASFPCRFPDPVATFHQRWPLRGQ